MMDENQFWKIIEMSREKARKRKRDRTQDFIDVHEQTLAAELRNFSPDDIIEFDDRFAYFQRVAYRWDLWAAAYWLRGGCSDDAFTDFRSCLISLGKDLFFQVLKDPDSLADIVDRPDMPYLGSEGFQYIASRVYKEKTGEEMPVTVGDFDPEAEPAGKRIDHDDEKVMRRRFPKLVAKYPDMGD